MSELPTGVLTFFFSDIENSTRLARILGDTYSGVLGNHHRIVREGIRAFRGVEVSTEGDSFFVVFSSPLDGIEAAVDIQRRVVSEEWGFDEGLAVRMGLHTGQASLGGDNYVGTDVHRASRICEAAHGGQILISETTKALVGGSTPTGIGIRDLGQHRLRGLESSERLFQLDVAGLQSEFPALRAAGATLHLPSPRSPLIGRQSEISAVAALLNEHRLVTITGIGGAGKTRLAIEVARSVSPSFNERVWFVELDAVESKDWFATTVAKSVGVTEDNDALEAIVDHFQPGSALLVLDNFEHLLEASGVVSAILERCPKLRILVTSRSLLRIEGEQAYPVPALRLPSQRSRKSVEASESGGLFIERVRQRDPSFELSDHDVEATIAILKLLDGIPLALEIAAARVHVFGIDELLEELMDRSLQLEGGYGDSPQRHKSLRAAMDWSYGLLDSGDRALFRKLAVFVGGFTLKAVTAVADPGAARNVVDGIESLTDSSLIVPLRSQEGERRFSMLTTVRSYALGHLEEAGEAGDTRRAHALYYLRLAEDAGGHHTTKSYRIIEQLRPDRANVNAALMWAASHEPEVGMMALPILARFFEVDGTLDTGRSIAETLLSSQNADLEARIHGLLGTASIVYWLQDYAPAEDYYRQALDLGQQLGESQLSAEALFGLAYTHVWQGRLAEARLRARQARAGFEETNDPIGKRQVLAVEAIIDWMTGDIGSAVDKSLRVRDLCIQQHDIANELSMDLNLSLVLFRERQWLEAAEAILYVVDRYEQLGDDSGQVMALEWLATAIAHLDAAVGLILEGFVQSSATSRAGSIRLSAFDLVGPQDTAASEVDPAEANRLLGEGRELDTVDAVALVRGWVHDRGASSKRIDVEHVKRLVGQG